MLSNTRIVLVNTSHPGNIGAAARAMKTMGLSKLYLVSPSLFPHTNANEMASGALDVLGGAKIVNTLDAAIGDCTLVVGASARSRTIPWPLLTPREFAEKASLEPHSQMAVIFGREQSGLTNEELHRCHFHIQIPSNPGYTSLNVAAAVQVIAYELRQASLAGQKDLPDRDYDYATEEEMNGFYAHLEQVLMIMDFLKVKAPRKLMTRLRRLFNRARPDVMEINILRGILGAISKYSENKL